LLIFRQHLSPSRRIFIGSHSLPPFWFAVSVLQKLICSVVLGMLASGEGTGATTIAVEIDDVAPC
jgi:hypothetical protein